MEMASPKYKKLKIMSQTDMTSRRVYSAWSLEECRMAFRLECFMLDCRVNMPTRYRKDLKCRACHPACRDATSSQGIDTSQPAEMDPSPSHDLDTSQPASREPTSSQAANQPTSDEDQDHIELCSGYAELWRDLGPYNQRARVQFFMRVKVKRLKMQHKEMRQQHQQQKQQKKLKQQQKQQHNQ